MYILVLEASTSAVKGMLYNLEKNEIQTQSEIYHGFNSSSGTITAEETYVQLMSIGKKLSRNKEIAMISLVCTWHSIVFCDDKFEAKTPIYLWPNKEAAQISNIMRSNRDWTTKFYQKTGCVPNAIYPAFKIKHFYTQNPKLNRLKIMDQGSYLNYKLTGEFVTTKSLASGTGLLNINSTEYDSEILEDLGIEVTNLPELIEFDQTYPLKEQVASDLGLHSGIPVVLSNPDGGLNQIGAGAMHLGTMTFSVGTSGAIRLSSPKPLLPSEQATWCYLAPKNTWLSGAATNGACNCVNWFIDNFTDQSQSFNELEQRENKNIEAPIFLPFIFGERCPGWDDKRSGGFVNVKDIHNKNDFYYALQEGVLFNLYQCYKILIRENQKPRHVKLSGGIVNSQRWSQMAADIFQISLEVGNVEHESLLGGAILAHSLFDKNFNLEEYQTKIVKTYEPNSEMKELYKNRFDLYNKYYRQTT